jgi:hypothetical protein
VSYDLQAVIAETGLLTRVISGLTKAWVAPLAQGLSLVAMTQDFVDEVTAADYDGSLGFEVLPGGFKDTLADWSVDGPVAYVEAEYFGGTGGQRAALWRDGRLAWGPVGLWRNAAQWSGRHPDLASATAARRHGR